MPLENRLKWPLLASNNLLYTQLRISLALLQTLKNHNPETSFHVSLTARKESKSPHVHSACLSSGALTFAPQR